MMDQYSLEEEIYKPLEILFDTTLSGILLAIFVYCILLLFSNFLLKGKSTNLPQEIINTIMNCDPAARDGLKSTFI